MSATDAHKPIVVKIDRELYYDNEEITGDVTFRGQGTTTRTYKSVLFILWARFVQLDDGVPGPAFSVFMLKMPIAQELEIKSGETRTIPFQFIIPPASPPSFTTSKGSLQWRVAVVHETPARKAIRAVAAKTFRKASLYHSLPAYLPKAQSEVQQISRQMLRAEATLSRDVYSTDEEIGVSVTIHEEGTHKLPAVTSVKAKVVQHVRAVKGNVKVNAQHKLGKVVEDISTWTATHLADNKGCVVEKTLTIKPKLDSKSRPKCGHQIVQRGEPGKNIPTVNVLAPTCKFAAHDGLELQLTYEVQVEVRTPSGRDILLSIPFVMQSERAEAVRVTNEDDDVLHKLPVFCNVDDELPAYEDVEKLSLPSYTSLRRNSIDTVFAAALPVAPTLSVPTPTTSPRRRRHSSAVLPTPELLAGANAPDRADSPSDNSNGGLAPQAPRSRRGSLSVFGFGHKEKHEVAVSAPSDIDQDDAADTPRQRRRSSVVGLLLENPVSATANRTLRRLRANTHSGMSPTMQIAAQRRGSMRSPQDNENEAEDPQAVLANFKARYMADVPVRITLDACQDAH